MLWEHGDNLCRPVLHCRTQKRILNMFVQTSPKNSEVDLTICWEPLGRAGPSNGTYLLEVCTYPHPLLRPLFNTSSLRPHFNATSLPCNGSRVTGRYQKSDHQFKKKIVNSTLISYARQCGMSWLWSRWPTHLCHRTFVLSIDWQIHQPLFDSAVIFTFSMWSTFAYLVDGGTSSD